MFCNGPRMDEGDIARLGPTTIAGMTNLKVLFVLDHDYGRYRWFGSAHQLPPILGVVHTSDGRRNMRRFVYFCTDAHIWLGVTRYFTYIYIYMSLPLLLLLLFFFFFFLTLGALFCIDGLLAAWHTLWPRVRL